MPQTNIVEEGATFKVTPIKESPGDSPVTTRKAVAGEMKNLPVNTMVSGFVGETPPSLVVEETGQEKLSTEEQKDKRRLRDFLSANIEPPFLSSKASPRKAANSLNQKLRKMTLGELRRFWSKSIPETPSDVDRELIQSRWDEVSP